MYRGSQKGGLGALGGLPSAGQDLRSQPFESPGEWLYRRLLKHAPLMYHSHSFVDAQLGSMFATGTKRIRPKKRSHVRL